MSRLPVVSANELIKALEKQGFQQIRQRGSHIVMQKKIADGAVTTVVPNHKEIAHGTLRSILKKTGISAEELARLLTVVFGIVFKFW